MPLFWHNFYNKEGPRLKKIRRFVFSGLTLSILAPFIALAVGCMPLVMQMIVNRTRAMEHPPESDPSIIADIYFGRTPKKSSTDTDRSDNTNPASVITIDKNKSFIIL